MKFNNLFFMALVLVLICSCKDTTLCYKIPLDNKELVICIPAFSDYAYLYIDAHESCVPTDSFDFKINNRGEATEVSLILNKHKDDTIYYSDRWNDVTLVNKNGKYKRVSWHDDRFYTKDIRTNKIQINQNYIEIVIKDYATFVVCQTDNGYKILEPIQKIGNNKELTCKDRIVYENIEYSHIKEKRDNT